jgi:uncharacterized ferritin-like protein (DUF455 family)
VRPLGPDDTVTVGGLTYRKDPARETCFSVVHDDAEMRSFSTMSDEGRRERLHRHMNNEIGSLEIAAQMLTDFPEAPWELRMELARQCWDETRHVELLHRRLVALGGRKGEFPVANLEWRVTCMLETLAARLAVQNRTFEAGQMDIVRKNIEEWREAGDAETASILDGILADEIQHVRFANRWLRRFIAEDRRLLMKVAAAMAFLTRATAPRGGTEDEPARPSGINVDDRRLAEFTDDEIREVLRQVGLGSLDGGEGPAAAAPRPGESSPGSAGKDDAGRGLTAAGGGGGSRTPRTMRSRIPGGGAMNDPAVSPRGLPDQDRAGNGQARDTADPALYVDNPARDGRFTVVDRWEECVNLPDDHPEKGVEFLHRQMNEEINGLENSARCLADFPDADWDLRLCIARQCADEARHVEMFRRLCEARGGAVGRYPVMNFQYRIISRLESLAGRLAVQNRTFEAEGLDAIGYGIDDCRDRGDTGMAAMLDAQLADEIGHVRYANEWLRAEVKRSPRTAMDVVRSIGRAASAFQRVVGEKGGQVVKYLVAPEGRLEAGFSPDEVRAAAESVRARRRGNA